MTILYSEDADEAVGGAPSLKLSVDDDYAGERLDKALAQLIPDVSRSRLQQWINAGAVRVNGAIVRARHALAFGDVIELEPQPAPDAAAYAPESMPLDIVFEDESLLIVNKPPGLVVHPAAGNWSGTLLNGLLAYAPALAELPRAGIVHRLDADTSGLMVVAKTLAAHTDLVRQLGSRTATREYWAVVLGATPQRGVVDAAIGRDPRNPLRFKVSTAASAKPARTQYARIDSKRERQAAPISHGLPAGSKPVAHIKFVCTSNTSGIRSSAIRSIGDDYRRAMNARAAGRHSIGKRCMLAG